MTDIKPIETVYNGYRFRSRLEARWAVFFDLLGIKYEYEKEGYDLGKLGWYLPDFWLPYQSYFEGEYRPHGLWLEIKGNEPTEHEKQKLIALSQFTGHFGRLAVGLPGSGNIYCASGITSLFFVKYENISIGGEKYNLKPLDHLYVSFEELFDLALNVILIPRAAELAKSARFEFGESGVSK